MTDFRKQTLTITNNPNGFTVVKRNEVFLMSLLKGMISLSVALLTLSHTTSAELKTTQDRADRLRQFLQKPEVGDLVVERFNSNSRVPIPKVNAKWDSNDQELFHVRWESDGTGFLLRRLAAGGDYQDPSAKNMFMCGGYGTNYWFIQGPYLSTYSPETLPLPNAVPSGNRNRVLFWAITGPTFVNEVLRLGLLRIQTSTMNWEGNRFTAQSIDGQPLEGSMMLDEHGIPKRIQYSYVGSDPLIIDSGLARITGGRVGGSYFVDYAYQEANELNLPSHITVSHAAKLDGMTASGEFLRYHIRVATPDDSSSKHEKYSYEQFTMAPESEVEWQTFFEGNEEYRVTASGVVEHLDPGNSQRLIKQLRLQQYFFGSAVAIMLLLPIVYLFNKNKRNVNRT